MDKKDDILALAETIKPSGPRFLVTREGLNRRQRRRKQALSRRRKRTLERQEKRARLMMERREEEE